MFATHQHALFSDRLGLFPSKIGTPPGQLKHTETWCIKGRPELDSEDTLSADTDFLISPGVNTTSLAFQVAASEVLSLLHGARCFVTWPCVAADRVACSARDV